MFPNLALTDRANVHVRDAIFGSERDMRRVGTAQANDKNIILGEFCSTVRRTSEMNRTSLALHVQDIVGGRTSDEMARIATRRIVAGVTNVLVGSKFTVEKLEREAMSLDISAIFTDVSVALSSAIRAEPRPARVWSAGSIEF